MAEEEKAEDPIPGKKPKRLLLLAIPLVLLAAGGGFFAAYSGMILGKKDDSHSAEAAPGPLPDIAFVPVDPLVITLGSSGNNRHLRMTSQLEVAKPHAAEVALLMPRILDVLNSYLRAIEIAQIEKPAALVVLRAQMLRRIQIVTGEGRVRDLLITEFVLN
jgi:flagellar protein FliL